jgi:hypothetical protein
MRWSYLRLWSYSFGTGLRSRLRGTSAMGGKRTLLVACNAHAPP